LDTGSRRTTPGVDALEVPLHARESQGGGDSDRPRGEKRTSPSAEKNDSRSPFTHGMEMVGRIDTSRMRSY